MGSPRSRGKGGRRVPWRDGGRGKSDRPEWRKQAMHISDHLPADGGEIVELSCRLAYGFHPGDWIYRFDQQMAKIGCLYSAKLNRIGNLHEFVIRVPEKIADSCRRIVARIEGR